MHSVNKTTKEKKQSELDWQPTVIAAGSEYEGNSIKRKNKKKDKRELDWQPTVIAAGSEYDCDGASL
jgi:hypothetical protein